MRAGLAVAGLLRRVAPALILHTVDVVYDSGAMQDNHRNFFEPYRISGTPIFLSRGNYDVKTSGRFALEAVEPHGTVIGRMKIEGKGVSGVR